MLLEGTVKDGLVVLDQKDAIPEGTRVDVSPIEENSNAKPTLGQRLMWLAGAIEDIPAQLPTHFEILVIQDREISEALTADHHFEQAGFIALLK